MNDLAVQERTLGHNPQYSSPHGNAGGISMHKTQEEEIDFGALYRVPSADQQEAMMYSMRRERYSSTNEIDRNEIRSETRQPCTGVEDSIPTSSSPNKYMIYKGASSEISSSSITTTTTTTTTGYTCEKEKPLNQEGINKGDDADYPRNTNIDCVKSRHLAGSLPDGDGNLIKQNTNSSEANFHSGALKSGIAGQDAIAEGNERRTKGEGNGAESRNDKDESERGNPPRLRPIKPIGALGRSNTVSGHTLHIMTRMFRPKPNSSSSSSTVTTAEVNVNLSVKRGVNSSVRSRESLMTSSSSTSVSASTDSQKGAGLSNNNNVINNKSNKSNSKINNNIGISGGEAGGVGSASNGSSSRSPGFYLRSRSHHHQLKEQELEQQRLQRTAPAASEQRERSQSHSLFTAMNSVRRLFASSGPSRSSASTSTSTSTSFSTHQSPASHTNPPPGEMLYSSMNSPACNLTSGAGSNSNIPGATQGLNYRLGYSGIVLIASAAPLEQQEEQELQQQEQREEQVPSPPRAKASTRAIGGGRGGNSIRAVGVTDSSPAAADAAADAPTTTGVATASGGEKTGRAQQGRSIFSNNSLYQSISSGLGSAAAGEREGREGRGGIALSVGSRSVDSALSSYGDCDASVDYSAQANSATATGRKAAEGTGEGGVVGLRVEAGGVNASLGASVHTAAASGFSGASEGSANVADHQAVKVTVKVSFRFPLKELAKNDPKLRQRDARAPLPQDLTIKHFRDVKHLADGTNANIYTGILQGEQVIIKIIKKDMVDNHVAIRELDDEFMLLSRLRHPHIVRVYGRGILPRKFIVLEYLAHGTLRFLLSKQSQNRGVGFFKKPIFPFRVFLLHARDMALAFDYLHRTCHPGACVIHRDLKPDNIGFGSDGRLRIFDFGLSTCIHARHYATQAYQMTGQTGSLRYMAPEVALSKKYTETVDVHSYGILVWQMLTETAPFQGLSRAGFIEEVARGGRRPPIDPYRKMWPPELCDLLERCWHPDPFQRPSFKFITMELDELVRKS